jgi:predicted ribosomally synthesized peptide with SipW-like signal peptide
MKRKILAVALMVCVLVLSAVTGTLAWLTDSTEAVENTFLFGKVEVTLNSPETIPDTIVPGNKVPKTADVTVSTDSVNAWVFVKVDVPAEFKVQAGIANPVVINYQVGSGVDQWTLLDATNNVYGYNSIMTRGNTTSDLFTEIGFDSGLSSEQVLTMNGKTISARAAAVQAEGVNSLNDAWSTGLSGTFPPAP